VTGVLKKFFRELPEPLVPFRMYSMFSDASRGEDTATQLQTFKALFKMLPPVNLACLNLLIPFLKEVSHYSATNRMDPSNLGIVFGPTLMRSEDPMQGMLNDRSAVRSLLFCGVCGVHAFRCGASSLAVLDVVFMFLVLSVRSVMPAASVRSVASVIITISLCALRQLDNRRRRR
jgi:RhoGAP domain